jgi:hypothetical protein
LSRPPFELSPELREVGRRRIGNARRRKESAETGRHPLVDRPRERPPELAAAQRKLPKIDMHMLASNGPDVEDAKVLPGECFPLFFCDVPSVLTQKPGDTLRYTLKAMDRSNIGSAIWRLSATMPSAMKLSTAPYQRS